ncbi:MAG: cytochrome C assembly protein [Chloroflexi bacterium]|nr:MAG: cytochrome C assembly protein [Chloroflexota bacterium]
MSAVKEMSMQQKGERSDSGSTLRTRLLQGLTVITVLAVLFGAYVALFVVGTDETQGEVQRIFYFHVSSFAAAFIGFTVGVVGGALYLWKRQEKWDALALAGIEVGFTLSLINLITGMVWARPIWNTWWTWDPRLTSAAIMCLTYAAYLMLRNGIENRELRRRFASIYGILAMSTVIFTLVIIRVRPDTIHPVVIEPQVAAQGAATDAEGSFTMSATISQTLGINSFIWSVLLPLTLIWWRVRLQNAAERVEQLKAKLLEQ